MLKLTYTDDGFWLEHLSATVETWLQSRLLVSLHSGTALTIEPTTASFLLPEDLPELATLEALLWPESGCGVAMAACDAGYVEICLNGTWVGADPEAETGVFVTRLGDRTETFLYRLWRQAEAITELKGD